MKAGRPEKPTILIPFWSYLPGVEGGGPIRSMSNLVERLSDQFDFKVLTSSVNLDQKDSRLSARYQGWVDVGSAKVRYLTAEERHFFNIAHCLLQIDYDAIYVNGFWPTRFTHPVFILKYLKLLSGVPVVVTPRGQFNEEALKQNGIKKRLFLEVAKRLGVYDDVFWQATNDKEARQIRTHFGTDVPVQIAPNLGSMPEVSPGEDWPIPTTSSGELNVVFLSRIVPIKNLVYALECLGRLDGDIQFDIYGPVESEEYWEACRGTTAQLPHNVDVQHHGVVEHDEVFEIFGTHDLFLLPTKGENFGHVINEALLSGCPVLISDATPWKGLSQKQVGWNVPLSDRETFVEKLQWCVNVDEQNFRLLRTKAREYALELARSGESVQRSRRLFERALRMNA
jgi:glycosyltransferase involved in cell wall biosynthesis